MFRMESEEAKLRIVAWESGYKDTWEQAEDKEWKPVRKWITKGKEYILAKPATIVTVETDDVHEA